MPPIVILTQVLLPIALLVWLAWRPTSSILGYGLQVAANAAILFGLTFAGLWAFPPYWVPWLYEFCLIAIVAWQVATGRADLSLAWSAGRAQSGALIALLTLAFYCNWLGLLAVKGGANANVDTVDIAPPFGPGYYLVANGGSTETVNPHLRTLDESVARYLPWRGQSRGVDVFKITALGLRVSGWRPVNPAHYESYGVPLVAPCAGIVVMAHDGLPDMPVPEMDSVNKLGNYVAIDCGEFIVFLAHMRKGSVRVSSGQVLVVGQPLGEIGNSGQTSEPHLHIHAQRNIPDNAPVGGEPLGLTINGRFIVRNDRLSVPQM